MGAAALGLAATVESVALAYAAERVHDPLSIPLIGVAIGSLVFTGLIAYDHLVAANQTLPNTVEPYSHPAAGIA
jgi:hypothetical protein